MPHADRTVAQAPAPPSSSFATTGPEHGPAADEDAVRDAEEEDGGPEPGVACELLPALAQLVKEPLPLPLDSTGNADRGEERGRHEERHRVDRECDPRASRNDEDAAERGAEDADEVP
jgi:hypothetical protein